MKKAMAILLSVVLLVGMLAGCGSSAGSTGTTDSSTATGSSSSSGAAATSAPSVSTGTTTVAMTDSKEDRPDLDATVLIYGNANNDAYVAEDDVTFLEEIVSGRKTWNKDENPMADTDCDGEITQNDIDLLKKIINKETCEVFIKNY